VLPLISHPALLLSAQLQHLEIPIPKPPDNPFINFQRLIFSVGKDVC
jgi:hypothetical protein